MLSEYVLTSNRRIKDLEKMNEALRIALQSKIRDEGMLDSLYSNKIVSEKTFELCHTPHFLGPSDKAGICSGPTPRLTGYRVAGHY